jgi:acetyl esterase/lipase
LYQLASPAQFVSSNSPPMFFFHGEKDTLASLSTVKNMSKELDRLGVASEVFVVPQKAHVLTMFDAEGLRRGIEFLKAHLSPRKD